MSATQLFIPPYFRLLCGGSKGAYRWRVEQTGAELYHPKIHATVLATEVRDCLLHRLPRFFLSQIRVEQDEGVIHFVNLDEGNARQVDEEEVGLECDLGLLVPGF